MTQLKYNGNGGWITGIPARDLDDNEVTQLASDLFVSVDDLITLLTARGLYRVESKPQRKPKADLPVDSEVTDDGS